MAKKIKKLEPIKKCTNADALKDFVIQENKKQKREPSSKPRKTKIDRYKPSTIPSLMHWKENKLKDWCCTDFLGYYLNKYNEIIGEEDIAFVNTKPMYSFGKERNFIKRCLENIFDNDKLDLKKYIDFIIPWWISKDSFTKDLPNLYAIFGAGGFIKIYRQTKLKGTSRAKMDNKFAEKDAWDGYFKEKDGE
jgi:hypothetical protein